MLTRILLFCGILMVPITFLVFPLVSPYLSGKSVLSGEETVVSSELPAGVENSGDKPTLFIFTASWCPPCKQMKSSVYPSDEVKEVSNYLNWVFIDIDDPENRILVTQYAVKGVPSFFLEDVSGNPVASLVGGASPADFKAFLQKAL